MSVPSTTGLPHLCGGYGLRRIHRLQRHRLSRLHRLGRVAPVLDFAAAVGARGGWTRHRRPRRRQPSVVWLLLAGLAVVGFAKLMTTAQRGQRTKTEKFILGGLLLVLGAIVLSFRRSAARYR